MENFEVYLLFVFVFFFRGVEDEKKVEGKRREINVYYYKYLEEMIEELGKLG